MKKETERKAAAPAAQPVAQAKQPDVKKTDVKKSDAKKSAAPRKRAAKVEQAVYVQYGDGEWNMAALVEAAKSDYAAQGHDPAQVKKLSLYVKPQDGRAYYVINDADTGSVTL